MHVFVRQTQRNPTNNKFIVVKQIKMKNKNVFKAFGDKLRETSYILCVYVAFQSKFTHMEQTNRLPKLKYINKIEKS